MEACILICKTKKEAEHKNRILFIRATDLVERKNGESFLTENHIEEILDLYNRYCDVVDRSAVIENEIICNNEFSISPKLYVKRATFNSNNEDLIALFNNWKNISQSAMNSITNLNKFFCNAES